MKQIEARIMGQGYILSCPEGGEAGLLEAVGRVDAAMCKIRDAGRIKARDRIAVLAALNLAFELIERERLPVATVPDPNTDAPTLPDESGQATLVRLRNWLDQALGEEDGQLL
ncbi:MAG: cell division protein ZapA [Burkholderiaceae bacterium]|jgi:cell division protein ZapA|nr:cell division protein ZapA [Burkholderiaceae bacterium]